MPLKRGTYFGDRKWIDWRMGCAAGKKDKGLLEISDDREGRGEEGREPLGGRRASRKKNLE